MSDCSNLSCASILIVDDIPENIRVVASTLGPCNFDMSFATSGPDAIAAVKESRFDLILLDIMMPGMDGLEACKLLKQLPGMEDVPIIFLTALSDSQSVLTGFEVGGVDYVTKPFHAGELVSRVTTHLQLRLHRRELLERNLSLEAEIERRKQTERSLWNSQQEVQSFLENISELALYRALDGTPKLINRALREMTGVDLEQMPTLASWLSLIHPDEREQVRAFFEEHPEGVASRELLYRLRNKEGKWQWIESRMVGMADRHGGYRGYHDIGRDVTERKQAIDTHLEHLHGKLDAVLEVLPDMMFILDAENRFIDFRAPAGSELLLRSDQFIGQRVEDVMPAAVVELVTPAIDEARACGHHSGCVYPLDFDSGRHWYELSISTTRTSSDTQLVVLARDITERQQSMDRLRQSAAVFDNLSEGILITDAEQRIVAVNSAFTLLTGYSEGEIIGKTPAILQSGEHDRIFYSQLWHSLSMHDFWQGELWNRRKGGEGFPAIESITAVRDEEQEVIFYIGIFDDITERRQSEEQIRYLVHQDVLTSLPNRKLLFDRLDQAISRARRNEQKVALIYLDIDRFKHINESMGHPVGDRLLKLVAERIQSITRESDLLARLGGDEFVVLIEDFEESLDSARIAEKLLDVFDEAFEVESLQLYLTVSIGISLFPDDGQDGDSLMKCADSAMYSAKERGGDNYRFFTNELSIQAVERVLLESHLRRALDGDEIKLYFQPQISLSDSRVVGAEVLLRWAHPEFGLIYPDTFIPLAEESGLILPLGEMVIRRACEQLREWRTRGVGCQYLAVNVSAIQVSRSPLVRIVSNALDGSAIPHGWLELEITENVIMQDPERAIEVFDALKELGIGLALDDFGTGYSSLSYLKRLPIDKLKVDKSFVMDIPHDKSDEVITQTVIALGKSLGMKVIAEGVETPAQESFLRRHGCDEGQGYLYGRPMPEEQFVHWLSERPIRGSQSNE